MSTRELRVKYAAQQSFYKKAFVKEDKEDKEGIERLYSYYSLIITNYGKALKFEEDVKLYSNTTMKHVREYLRQADRWDLAALSRTKLLKRLGETDYIILDIL